MDGDRGAAERDAARELLLAEFSYLGDAFWRNEEMGEKRVMAFFALATVLGTAITLLIGQGGFTSKGVPITVVVALALLGIFGRLTFLRIIKRNVDTDSYKEGMALVRRYFLHVADDRLRAHLYFDPHAPVARRRLPYLGLGMGGWLQTVMLVNAVIVGALTMAVLSLLLDATPIIVSAGAATAVAAWVGQGWNANRLYERLRRSDRGQYYRAGAGAVILDGDGRVLALERRDVPGAWQLPQGGLREREEPLDAVLREILEETGLPRERLELLGRLPEPLAYELPPGLRSAKTGRGQVNHWFIFRLKGAAGPVVPPAGEFRRARWMPVQQVVDDVVGFRKGVYSTLLEFLEQKGLVPQIAGGRS